MLPLEPKWHGAIWQSYKRVRGVNWYIDGVSKGAAAALADCHCVHKWTTSTIVVAAAYAADALEVMFYF